MTGRAAEGGTVPHGASGAATIGLHRDFYRPDAVEKAAAAFAALAECAVEQDGAYVRVSLTARGAGDPELLARQLANWALAASVVGAG